MTGAHPIARFGVVLAAAVCTALTVGIWRSVSAQQSTWPLPALYFIELSVVAILCAVVFVTSSPSRTVIAWVASGIFAAFAILGAWTVGFYYLPFALVFLIAAVVSDVRRKGNMAAHAGVWLIAFLAQAGAMLLLAWVS
jgi:hypothetical protein